MTARQFTPRPYQQIIIDHILANDRCAVWAGMCGCLVLVLDSTTAIDYWLEQFE